MVMVSVLPVSVVAPPRAPPKRAVSGRRRAVGQELEVVVKADADAARPRTNNDCFMVMIMVSAGSRYGRWWERLCVAEDGGGSPFDGSFLLWCSGALTPSTCVTSRFYAWNTLVGGA